MKAIQFILTFLFLGTPWMIFAQNQSDDTYWQKHSEAIDVDQNIENFTILDTVLPDYSFFFTAEQHWQSINTQIQFSFLRYLHRHAGVRNFIVEGGYSYGFLLNRFLQTGDERLLDKVVNDIPVCPDNQLNMFRRIYRYNQTLPKDQRIQVTGIDLEHSAELSIQCLNTLKGDKEPDRKIAKYIDRISTLHQLPTYDEREVKRFFSRMYNHMQRQPKAYKEFWGADYARVNLIIENTLQGFGFDIFRVILFPQKWQAREERMYKNFLILQDYMAKGNYYAQFGALHTDIKESFRWDFPSLAHRLNYFNGSPVQNEVLTISRYFRDMKDNYDRLGESDSLHSIMGEMEKNHKDEIVLLSLIGKNSPFPKLSQTFQFIMLLDEDLEKDRCE